MSKEVIKAVEEKYPETAQEFKANLDRMYETFCSKMWDYGSHNIALGRTSLIYIIRRGRSTAYGFGAMTRCLALRIY